MLANLLSLENSSCNYSSQSTTLSCHHQSLNALGSAIARECVVCVCMGSIKHDGPITTCHKEMHCLIIRQHSAVVMDD